MIDVSTLFSKVFLFVALLVPGFILGKKGRISDESVRGITAVVSDVAMPFLVFVKLVQTDFVAIGRKELLFGLLLSAVLIVGMYLLSGILYRKDDLSGRSCATFSNCGFISLPLAAIMFPETPSVVGIISLFNLVHTALTLTLGIALFSGDRRHIKPRGIVFKPITFAIVLGFAFSFLKVGETLPSVVEYADLLAMLGTPLAMIILGVELAKFPLGKVFNLRVITVPALVRLLVAPLFAILLCAVCNMSQPFSVALFLCCGAPAASISVAFARTYGRDAERAAIITLSTTVLCVVTLPLMSFVFRFFFG